jgi:hypothetical protein
MGIPFSSEMIVLDLYYRFCTKCRKYDHIDKLVLISTRAYAHPACLLKKYPIIWEAREKVLFDEEKRKFNKLLGICSNGECKVRGCRCAGAHHCDGNCPGPGR